MNCPNTKPHPAHPWTSAFRSSVGDFPEGPGCSGVPAQAPVPDDQIERETPERRCSAYDPNHVGCTGPRKTAAPPDDQLERVAQAMYDGKELWQTIPEGRREYWRGLAHDAIAAMQSTPAPSAIIAVTDERVNFLAELLEEWDGMKDYYGAKCVSELLAEMRAALKGKNDG